ncbi:Gamma Purothionin [Trema orientale]|uniref:Gamma Purothionin n=2 Tax=Cannabaceae TaxID=3481 RepID=A0A2P5AGD9_PARAD|nr:Gamma Purothionin [Parasponia andersonii]PON83992.1 Gamma Purothionin [Trema orientale]
MEKKVRFGGMVFFLLFILLASQEMVVPTEGRVCESKSHHYKRACLADHNCAMVCRTEGFTGGKCRGFRRRCFCTRRC